MLYKLGSITAVMDGESGTITQAQDYDAWGDICRSYSTTDTTVNKFTGKERDAETGYDYFGARYYDSRIGRWLQTEPLYDKYLQYSPYIYSLNNILKYIDKTGLDVTLKGSDENIDKGYEYLKNYVKGFEISLNGSMLTASSLNNNDYNKLSEEEKLIYDAIISDDKHVYLHFTEEHYYETEAIDMESHEQYTVRHWFIGGAYGGHISNVSDQYLNLDDLDAIETITGCSVGNSISHELLESYAGIKDSEYKLKQYLELHNYVNSIMKDALKAEQNIIDMKEGDENIGKQGYLIYNKHNYLIWQSNF